LRLAGLLASLRPKSDLSLSLRILQEIEMGRPSLIEATARKVKGQVIETTIAGRRVAVMTGAIVLAE
jgi:trans-2,3-dihydro-3-hydroxyanthranilate isomerase